MQACGIKVIFIKMNCLSSLYIFHILRFPPVSERILLYILYSKQTCTFVWFRILLNYCIFLWPVSLPLFPVSTLLFLGLLRHFTENYIIQDCFTYYLFYIADSITKHELADSKEKYIIFLDKYSRTRMTKIGL